MARIIVQPSEGVEDLPDGFVRALTLLSDRGLRPIAGTKLVSKYAVIVVHEPQASSAIDCLRAGNLPALLER